MQYSDSIKKIEPDTDIPIVLTGDFNIDVQGNQSLLEFTKREFRLEYVPTTPTTRRLVTQRQTLPSFETSMSLSCHSSLISLTTDFCYKIVIDY
jgi:hypothetical protein